MKKFIGKTMAGKVVSVHMGNNEDLSKDTRGSLTAEIGGFAGDKHQGLTRKAWKGDWESAGTVTPQRTRVVRCFSRRTGSYY